MNMFKTTAAKTPEEYISLIEDSERKSQIETLYNFIKKLVPQERPNITSGMIGFGLHPYKTKSGKEGEWPLILLASQKNYISIYACALYGKEYVAERYKNELPKASIGKSCIRFKKIEDINLKVLEKLINEVKETGFNLGY